jgi:histidinol-phosphate aminotransferase
MLFLDNIKPQVRALRAYALKPERVSVKLNQNENPWDAPDALKAEILARLARLNWARYPDFAPVSLHEKLAEYARWRADGVLVGNGSNELIQALLTVAVWPGQRVLLSEPTFTLYRQIATVQGGEVLNVPPLRDFSYDVTALCAARRAQQPAVTILCSPNNPTGCALRLVEVAEILSTAPGLVAIDEAYTEFAYENYRSLLAHFPNLILLRTFSKALGLAAWRVGYLLAAPELAREIGKALLPYNVNQFSLVVAETALARYDEILQPQVRQIVAERRRVAAEIERLPDFSVVPSEANFLLARSARKTPREVYEAMLRRGVLIRDVSGYPVLAEYFRVSIGTPDENDKMLAVLREEL